MKKCKNPTNNSRCKHIVKSERELCMSCSRIGQLAWNTGLTKETDERIRIGSDRERGNSGSLKGKTYEEIYGRQRAKYLKEIRSGFNNVSKRPEVKQKQSESKLGDKNPTKKRIGKTYIELFGEEKAIEIKQKQRLHRIKEINDKSGQCIPNYNPNGCKYFNVLMEQTGIHIQHAENGGEFHIKELGYWVDGYDKENNVVYEFDEIRHFINDKLKDVDIKRQKEIEKFLGCKIIRIREV